MEVTKQNTIFEGWANCYEEDGGIIDFALYGYALHEQAQKQLGLQGSKELKRLVGGKTQRVRVEIVG